MSKLITSEKRNYYCYSNIGLGVTCRIFNSGWQMIGYLSNIDAEAQKN